MPGGQLQKQLQTPARLWNGYSLALVATLALFAAAQLNLTGGGTAQNGKFIGTIDQPKLKGQVFISGATITTTQGVWNNGNDKNKYTYFFYICPTATQPRNCKAIPIEDRSLNTLTIPYKAAGKFIRSRVQGCDPANRCGTSQWSKARAVVLGSLPNPGSNNKEPDQPDYVFPVAPQRKSQNLAPGMSPIPCDISSCHRGTAAFDISRLPGYEAAAGTPVYAITDGQVDIVNVYRYNNVTYYGCYAIHFYSFKDRFWYWYGHLQNPKVKAGQRVVAGEQLAEIGVSRCTGNGSAAHLHIDRGCVKDGVPQKGGREDCRDPGFIPIMNDIWEALPD